jgi:hypothetical protein
LANSTLSDGWLNVRKKVTGMYLKVDAEDEARISTENFPRVRKMIPMEPYQIPEVWLLLLMLKHSMTFEIVLQNNISAVNQELVLFGLRTKLGIPRSRFSTMTGGKKLEDVGVHMFFKD